MSAPGFNSAFIDIRNAESIKNPAVCPTETVNEIINRFDWTGDVLLTTMANEMRAGQDSWRGWDRISDKDGAGFRTGHRTSDMTSDRTADIGHDIGQNSGQVADMTQDKCSEAKTVIVMDRDLFVCKHNEFIEE